MRPLAVLIIGLVPGIEHAQATIHVDAGTCSGGGSGSEDDPFCTIQEAVDVASSGDTILVGPGVYAEDVVLPGTQLTIRSVSGAESTEVRGIDATAMEVLPGGVISLQGLTFSSGADPRRGILCRQSTLDCQECRFIGTEDLYTGGAVCGVDSTLSFRECFFSDSSAYLGGAIGAVGGEIDLEGCRFVGTWGYMGAAVSMESGSLEAHNCFFEECSGVLGGAVYVEVGSARIRECVFLRDRVQDVGLWGVGGALWLESVDAEVSFCSFLECFAVAHGGAIWLDSGSIALEDSMFADNEGYDLTGTCVFLDSDVDLARCGFVGNQCECGSGGALYIQVQGTNVVSIRDSLFERNRAPEGGAICVRRGFADVLRCEFHANRTGGGYFWERGEGGGLFVGGLPGSAPGGVDARVSRCVFAKNLATGHYATNPGRGGGIYGPVEASNCTFYGNAVLRVGWKVVDDPTGGAAAGGAELRNCIAWQNAPDQLQEGATAVWSDIQDAWGGDGNFDEFPGFRDADALDFRLRYSSPCIDRGDPSEQDDDGTRIDVGAHAYEHDPGALVRRH